MALIELIDISKSYDGELVLDEFILKIKEKINDGIIQEGN